MGDLKTSFFKLFPQLLSHSSSFRPLSFRENDPCDEDLERKQFFSIFAKILLLENSLTSKVHSSYNSP